MQKKLKTLDRVLSKAGLGSRTEARSWIGAGRVTVNGKKVWNETGPGLEAFYTLYAFPMMLVSIAISHVYVWWRYF